MRARDVQAIAVVSSMLTASTTAFAWSATRCVDTQALQYVPWVIVTCTIWLLTVAFGSAVLWELGVQLTQNRDRPQRWQMSAPDEPEDWLQRVYQAQMRPGMTEVTLIDQIPAVTEEIPRVVDIHWRPPASNTAKNRGDQ